MLHKSPVNASSFKCLINVEMIGDVDLGIAVERNTDESLNLRRR